MPSATNRLERRARLEHGRCAEQLRAAGRRECLHLSTEVPPRARRAAVERVETEHLQEAVLATLHDEAAVQEHRRARAEVGVARVQLLLVGRRVHLADLQRRHRQLDDAVAEVRGPVVRRVAGRDEQVSARLDDGAGTAPDGRVARVARRRVQDPAPVGAQRVPDRHDAPARAVDERDVALIRRRIAVIAAGRDDEVRPVEVERRRELLVRGVVRHRSRPTGDDPSAAHRELVDLAVGGRRVQELVVGVDGRRRRGDLRAAGPARVSGRREGPQDRPAVRINRERAAVGRRHEGDVVRAAGDGRLMQVDRGGVDRAGQRDAQAAQMPDVRGGDAGRRGRGAVALGREVEDRPVLQRGRLRAGCGRRARHDRGGLRRARERGRGRAAGRDRRAAGCENREQEERYAHATRHRSCCNRKGSGGSHRGHIGARPIGHHHERLEERTTRGREE